MKRVQFILLILLLASCSSNQPVSVPTNPEIQPTSSPLSETTSSAPTLTPTSKPLPAFTSTPLWTPLPTFSSTAGEETLRVWVQGTSKCLLPCWGGITPGQTRWDETRQIVEQLSGFARVNVSENFSCEFGTVMG